MSSLLKLCLAWHTSAPACFFPPSYYKQNFDQFPQITFFLAFLVFEWRPKQFLARLFFWKKTIAFISSQKLDKLIWNWNPDTSWFEILQHSKSGCFRIFIFTLINNNLDWKNSLFWCHNLVWISIWLQNKYPGTSVFSFLNSKIKNLEMSR